MPKDAEPVMLGVALAFGGFAQLLAGMWEFRKGEPRVLAVVATPLE